MPILSNSKHEAVLSAFIGDSARVGWKAYLSVYPKSSQRAAETGWSRLLTRAEFKARHDELVNGITEAAKKAAVMDLTEVLEELSKLGRSNLQNVLIDGDDTRDVVTALRDMSPEDAAAVQEFTVETYVEGAGDNARDVKRVKIKLHDKRAALSELRRHHEPDKHEHSGKDGAPIKVEEDLSMTALARRIAFALQLAQREKKPAAAKADKPRK